MFDLSQGRITILEYMFQGKLHKTVNWTSASCMFENNEHIVELKTIHERNGAELVGIKKIECNEVELEDLVVDIAPNTVRNLDWEKCTAKLHEKAA